MHHMWHRYFDNTLPHLGSGLAIAAIFSLSFLTLSPQFDTHLNSDHAVHILMTYDLKLPQDLYYWGQDRLGSLIPIIAHYLLKVVPLAPVQVLGIVHYGILFVAYLCFASFLTTPLSRILLATAFFLPLQLYIEILQIGQPYTGQFACLGLATVGIRWLLNHWRSSGKVKRRGILALTLVAIIASLWMSDFSLIYWGVILGAIAHYLFVLLLPTQRRSDYPVNMWDGVALGIVGFLGFSFLRFAKNSASHSSEYTRFNTPAEVVDLMTRIGERVWANLQFQGKHTWTSMVAYTIIIIAILVIYSIVRHGRDLRNSPQSMWFSAWGLCTGCSLVVLLLSNWVYNPDHIPQRYFSVVYLLGWFTSLLIAEASPSIIKRLLSVALIGLALASGMSLQYRLFSDDLPRIVQLAPLKSLAPAGFIGNYWRSYVLCSANPELLDCTPYDEQGEVNCPKGNGRPYKPTRPVGTTTRCKRCTEQVLESSTVYFVKQKWLDRFPKRIEQYGYCFQRAGPSLRVGRYTIKPYERLE